ncbi:ADL216Cp [Eremothecium gossypii ATCC 10895]|uniref:Histone deacetylase n=1 Tax=Eremothecium gossypii (strain ATCC 10895 / CBS 109.51 / FGSC 9923 / NRRL Y-1056) TaxID=284811 RepID=Q75AY6_EREGS|nr:ADL216Cp [Eremothecium gossypii ATCC 10895]AAS51704.2 ADL216Cp [Eremothecium gossypii ATCC 10895]AEY96001.1 FADL216Cp [Eremothecium gossypii FDAG1]
MEERTQQKRKLEEGSPDGEANGGQASRKAIVQKRPVIVPPVRPKISYVPLKTGLCYDVRMRYHAKIFTSYFEYIDPHPEDPRRIYRIYKILAENGLIEDPTLSGIDEIGELMQKIPVREATEEEILTVHSKEHVEFLKTTNTMDREQLLKETEAGDSVYYNNDSLISARLSCGGAIEACKAVVEGRVKNAMAVVRPPGHHAEPGVAGGFCLFSNVAVAAQNILKNYPESVRRVMILDWDIHHGNGTQKAFYGDNRVLYVSLHRYELGKYYPGTSYGNYDQCGDGKGEGFNCNIPWSCSGVGDAEYMWAFEQVVIPMGREFQPDLVIISSGFDAADGDTIGQCHVSPACYGHLTHMLKSLARGNMCVVLEGGYNLDSIAKSALGVAKVLIGEPPDELPQPLKQPKPEAIVTIDMVIKEQSKYWNCFKGRHGNDGINWREGVNDSLTSKNFPLQSAVRQHQFRRLAKEYKFVTLPLLNMELPSDTIICSPNIHTTDAIIICVHDTPEIWAQRDSLTGHIDPSTSIIVDTTVSVINWALGRNYGVIDINIPQSLFEQDNYSAVLSSQEVVTYLWDSYLKTFPHLARVAFVGIGDAYSGFVHLLGHRDTRSVVKCAIAFADKKQLRPLVPLVDESLGDWYFKNSLVFTSTYHPCWGTDGNDSKKPRKKFGRVLRCTCDGMNNIVEERLEEATDFILDSFEEWSESE